MSGINSGVEEKRYAYFLAYNSIFSPGAGSLGRLSSLAIRSRQFPTAMSKASPKIRYFP